MDVSLTLQGWELLVLSRLKWDLAAITPNDFVNPLIRRLSAWTKGKEMIMKRHTQTFIALCAAGESMMKEPLREAEGRSEGKAS